MSPPAIPSAGAARVRAAAPAAVDPRAQLKRLSYQLESVFMNQLFQAMRAAVPRGDGGETAAGGGEELFTSLMDERVAELAAPRMGRGPGEALYRQLERRYLHDVAPTGSPADAAPLAPPVPGETR